MGGDAEPAFPPLVVKGCRRPTFLKRPPTRHSELIVTQLLPRKAFTVEEANGLIATIEAVMEEIARLRDLVESNDRQLQILDALWGPEVLASENPDHADFVRHGAAVDGGVERIQGLVREEIVARGIRFPPGGLEQGLLDFPTTLDGRWVYLCWRRGESRVDQWHEITDGFAGRQPVTPDHEGRMGVEWSDPPEAPPP